MKYIPADIYAFLQEHPEYSGSQLARALGKPERTCRRYRQYFNEGVAIPHQQQIVSQQMADLEAEEEEIDLDALFELAPKLVREAQLKDPVFTTDTFNMGNDPVAITFPSCAHLGGRYTAYTEFRDFFDRVLTIPNLYWASVGDDVEGFIPQFKDVSSVYDQIYDVRVQHKILDRILDILSENNKLLLGMASQHGGKWIEQRSGENPIKKMYLAHNVPFYDGKAYLRFVVGDQVYNVATAHVFPGTSQWNQLHAQTRALRFDFPNADLVIQGDKHCSGISEFSTYGWEYEAGNRASNKALLIQVGTAKTGADKYTIKNWSKGVMDWPTCVFYPNEHKIKWSWELDDIEMWLQKK